MQEAVWSPDIELSEQNIAFLDHETLRNLQVRIPENRHQQETLSPVVLNGPSLERLPRVSIVVPFLVNQFYG